MRATALKEEFVDPVCGMTVDPARAAGTSERDGETYYFCSPGCKQKFDAGAREDEGRVEEAQAGSYRTLMRKFWFAAIVGLPLLALMLAEFVPSLAWALMPWHRTIGV